MNDDLFLLLALLFVLVIFILTICAFIVGALLVVHSFVTDVPFVRTRRRAVGKAIDALQLGPDSVLYDIGSGDGNILVNAARTVPDISGVGIENGFILSIISRWRTRGLPITILNQDMFSTDFSTATHIYCYLSTSTLEKLSPKIRRECKKGTRIVACDYQFPRWKPLETIELATDNDLLSRRLYVYVL